LGESGIVRRHPDAARRERGASAGRLKEEALTLKAGRAGARKSWRPRRWRQRHALRGGAWCGTRAHPFGLVTFRKNELLASGERGVRGG